MLSIQKRINTCAILINKENVCKYLLPELLYLLFSFDEFNKLKPAKIIKTLMIKYSHFYVYSDSLCVNISIFSLGVVQILRS